MSLAAWARVVVTDTLTPDDRALSAALLQQHAAELRKEAAAHQRGIDGCFDKARAATYAEAYAMRVALAGAYERVAGVLSA